MSTYTPKASSYTIWDDAQSKVQFLQSGFKGKDWRTTLVYPYTPGHIKDADVVRARLSARGFLIKQGRDECGNLTLTIHHTGDGTQVTDVLKSEGLVKGAGHLISKPLIPLDNLVSGIGDTITRAMTMLNDPARASSGFYLAAESILLFAGFGNRYGHWLSPKNMLQNLAGALWLSQSSSYLAFAKRQDEVALETLNKQFNQLRQHNENPLDADQWNMPDKQNPTTLTGKARQLLEEHPIQMGAVLNNAGMLAHMMHTVLERGTRKGILANTSKHSATVVKEARDYVKSGFYFDFGRSLLSLIGWTALYYPVKEHPEKSDNPFTRAFQTFEEDPQIATGGLAFAAGLSSIIAGYKKNNPLQMAGETLYLPGDVLMMFANSSQYGKGAKQDVEKAARAITTFIHDMPLILGPQERDDTVKNIISYMAKLSEQQQGKTQETPEAEKVKYQQILYEETLRLLNKEEKPLIGLAKACYRLIHRFPETQHAEITAALSRQLANMPSIHASESEIAGAISARQQRCRDIVPPANHPAIHMKELAEDIADLAYLVPGIDVGNHALSIRRTLVPFTRDRVNDHHILCDAMDQKARQCLSQENATAPAMAR